MENKIFQKPFKLTGEPTNPENVNFDIVGLQKNYIVEKGELVSVGYYKNFNIETKEYSDLVVEINNTYNRDGLSIIENRVSVINYYDIDGNIQHNKQWTKYYPDDQAIDEGLKRRNNMLSAAKIVLLKELKVIYGEPTNQSYAFDLLTSVKTPMEYFKEGHTSVLRSAISSSTKPYLNESIKTLIITELTF